MQGLRAGFLAVLDWLGSDSGRAFGAKLDPGLGVFLVLGNCGRGHLPVPRVGAIHDSCAISTMNNASQIINISLKSCGCNGLPSLVGRNAAHRQIDTGPHRLGAGPPSADDRATANVAIRLAYEHPAEAERVLNQDPRIDFGQDLAAASEALLLARYDREVAATLFEPFAAYTRRLSLRDGSDINTTILLARAALDPHGGAALVESLPPARTLDINDPANWARYSVAEQLAEPPERRWMSIWRFYSGRGMALFEEAYRDL